MKSQTERSSSYGEHGLTLIDRFGVYLSKRTILRSIRNRQGLVVLDIGCGYNAKILTSLPTSVIREGKGIDIRVSDKVKTLKGFSFIEDDIEHTLPSLPDRSFDLIMMISVLEHLWQPQQALYHCFRLLRPGGILLINVPSWRGKIFLEISAFKLGTSPATEMDDHKMYYDKKDLWPLLVHAGFKPSKINLRYIKFGLNLFAFVCK